jgi:hypothetical protein
MILAVSPPWGIIAIHNEGAIPASIMEKGIYPLQPVKLLKREETGGLVHTSRW